MKDAQWRPYNINIYFGNTFIAHYPLPKDKTYYFLCLKVNITYKIYNF